MLTLFMHKLVLLIFTYLSLSVFYRLCREVVPENAGYTTIAFLLNPLIIVMTLVDGHNEIAMSFFVLCAFYLLVRSKYIFSFMLLALAIAVKFVYVILGPLFILYILMDNKAKDIKEKVYSITLGIVSFLAVTAIAWFPFGRESAKAVISYYIGLSKNFWSDSIPYVIYFILDKIGITIPKNLIAGFFFYLFVIIYFCILGYFLKERAKADRQAIFTSSALVLLALLFTNSTPFQAWYIIWVIPFIFLSRVRLKFHLIFLLSYFLIMTFWKRMFVLAIPMIAIYLFMLLFYKGMTGKTVCKNA